MSRHMNRSPHIRALLVFGILICGMRPHEAPAAPTAPQEPRPPSTAQAVIPKVVGFAPVADVRLYYEIYGSGEAILFMHGGGGSVRGSWPPEYASDLSRQFMVILADSRGHGNSTDGDGPITFGRLADDAVGLLDHLGVARARIVGHSAGAIAGLHLLIDFPDRVKTATLLAGAYHVDNYQPQAYADLKRELERLLRGDKFESRLASRPIPVLRKLASAWLAGPSFSLRVLETIRRPTLIVTAGQDIFFTRAIGEQMQAHIRGSELIHFPHATHRVQVNNSKEIIAAVRDLIGRRGNE
jgi:pimeloyl-ACP methyl ester carboxylesterase